MVKNHLLSSITLLETKQFLQLKAGNHLGHTVLFRSFFDGGMSQDATCMVQGELRHRRNDHT